jgi:hypothetical protein
VVYLGTAVSWNPKGSQWIQIAHRFIEVMVVTNSAVFAAYVFAYYYQARDSQIQKLRRVAQPALLANVLTDISNYHGIYTEDHTTASG